MYRYDGLLVAEYRDEAGLVEVVDYDGLRCLHFGTLARQSSMQLGHPGRPVIEYERAMAAYLLFNPEPKRVLIIGLGAGNLARFVLDACEHTRVDVVELRPLVVQVARQHFALEPDPRLRIAIGCGAEQVAQLRTQAAGHYDVILVDAYHGAGMAPAVASEEFFRHCRELLTDTGLLVSNLWRVGALPLPAVAANMLKAFGLRVHMIPEGMVNMIAFAFADGFPRLALAPLETRAARLRQRLQLDFPAYLQGLHTSDPMGRLFIEQ